MAETQSYQGAYETLVQKAYLPSFFTKLASYGIQPANDDEAAQMLALAAKLRRAELADGVKQAGQRYSVLTEVHNDLDRIMGQEKVAADTGLMQAAGQLAQDQEMHDAALVYQDYLNQVASAAQ